MVKYGLKAEVLKELLEKYKAESDAKGSDYYRGKSDAFELVLMIFDEE